MDHNFLTKERRELVGDNSKLCQQTGWQPTVSFEEMMNSDLKLGPDTYIMGNIGYMEKAEVPVPGTLERT